MAQPPRKEMFLSPFGLALHTHLNRADDKFGAPRFKTKLILDGADRDEFKGIIDKIVDDAFVEFTKDLPKAKASKIRKKYPYEEQFDDDGEPTGALIFKFIRNAIINGKDGPIERRPPLIVDSKRRPLKDPPLIVSGSEIRVAFTKRVWLNDAAQEVGATLDLEKVQIQKLADRASRPDNTFGDVEGGWDSERGVDDSDDGDAPAGAAGPSEY
jgi:hypothetical protein